MEENKRNSIQWSHISPLCLIRTLLSNLWMILATALICGMAVSLVLTWFFKPEYTAQMTYKEVFFEYNEGNHFGPLIERIEKAIKILFSKQLA